MNALLAKLYVWVFPFLAKENLEDYVSISSGDDFPHSSTRPALGCQRLSMINDNLGYIETRLVMRVAVVQSGRSARRQFLTAGSAATLV